MAREAHEKYKLAKAKWSKESASESSRSSSRSVKPQKTDSSCLEKKWRGGVQIQNCESDQRAHPHPRNNLKQRVCSEFHFGQKKICRTVLGKGVGQNLYPGHCGARQARVTWRLPRVNGVLIPTAVLMEHCKSVFRVTKKDANTL